MNDAASPIAPDARPRLPRGVRLVHNDAQGGWVLLAPERVFKADAIAAEIVKRCTGEATFGCNRRRSGAYGTVQRSCRRNDAADWRKRLLDVTANAVQRRRRLLRQTAKSGLEL